MKSKLAATQCHRNGIPTIRQITNKFLVSSTITMATNCIVSAIKQHIYRKNASFPFGLSALACRTGSVTKAQLFTVMPAQITVDYYNVNSANCYFSVNQWQKTLISSKAQPRITAACYCQITRISMSLSLYELNIYIFNAECTTAQFCSNNVM